MRNKLFIFPSVTVSMIVVVTALLFMFWKMQENKLYIIELAFPILLLIALFYLLAFNILGRAQRSLESPSAVKVLYSATLVIGVFTLLVFLVFITILKPSEGAIGSPLGSFELLRELLLLVFAPFWLAYVSGGLVQFLLIRGTASK